MAGIPQNLKLILLILIIAAFTVTTGAQQRLQVHAEQKMSTEWIDSMYVTAICDTGNGTMLYIVREVGRENQVALLANGCKKIEAER